jgi:hypothetical protein
VSARFVHAHGGVSRLQSVDWRERTQARLIREIERETLYDVTREAVMEAIFRYPADGARALFPWFRDVVARHALLQLRNDLSDDKTSLSGAEAEALQLALADLDSVEPPVMRERTGLRWWRRQLPVRDLYGTVDDFHRHGTVRRVCNDAIGRLPKVQAEVLVRALLPRAHARGPRARSGLRSEHDLPQQGEGRAQHGARRLLLRRAVPPRDPPRPGTRRRDQAPLPRRASPERPPDRSD